jgi:hypothetical protein
VDAHRVDTQVGDFLKHRKVAWRLELHLDGQPRSLLHRVPALRDVARTTVRGG